MSTSDKIKKLRLWITDKGKQPGKTISYEKVVTQNDLTKPFEFDVYADFISDAAVKKKVADFTFSYGDGTITPSNTKPIARAGNDQTVKPQTTVTLDGSLSSDPDVGDKIEKYEWTQTAGWKNVKLVYDSNLAIAKFIAPELGGTPDPTILNAKLKDSTGNVKPGDFYTIDGSQSTGNITQWAILQDNDDAIKVELQDSTLQYSKMFVMPDTADTLHFGLTVTDGTVSKVDSQTVVKEGVTSPPPTTGGKVLYDSNIDGKWNDGKSRTIKNGAEGNINPDGKGFYTAASGSPRFIIDGNGIGHLEADPGHGRIYIKAKNYNSRLEFDYMFEDTNVDNLSFKLRSRHQEGGDCANRFGGFGGAIDRAGGEIDFQTESCHNEHENKVADKIPAHKVGQWYRVAISVCDSPDKKQVNLKAEIDNKDGQGFKKVVEGSHKNPAPAYIDEASFAKDSYFWLRMNNEKKTGRIAFKDLVLTRIEPAGTNSRVVEAMTTAATISSQSDQQTANTLTFQLKVTDTKGLTATDDVNIIVTGASESPSQQNLNLETQKKTKIIGFEDIDTTQEAGKLQIQILKEPDTDLIIGLGDYPYKGKSTEWTNMMDRVWTPEQKGKLTIIKSNHEDEESKAKQSQIDIEQWVNKHNANHPQYPMPKLDVAYEQSGDATWEKTTWLSSHHINNVYIINMNTQDLDVEFERNQFNWVKQQIDFAKRLKDANKVDWIIATSHKPWFTLKTLYSPSTAVRNVYNDMFRNIVDFNLHGHNINTQLWKPMIVDKTQGGNGVGLPLYSLASDGLTFDFSKEHGWLTIVSGHGGYGGGSEHNTITETGNQNVLWYNDSDFGYTVLEIQGKKAKVLSKDVTGKILYEYNVQK